MRRPLWAILGAAAMAACATGTFPQTGDPNTFIASAERALNDARSVGADSLAAAEMREAMTKLESARSEVRNRRPDRAELNAREAAADARYARSLAMRAAAERTRNDAQTALQAIPAGGNP